MRLIARVRDDERGSALITALLAAVIMLALGLALLSIVDTQANESSRERTRDRGFNVSESVLTSEAFVLGRSWPDVAPAGDPLCGAAGSGFSDTIGATSPASAATARLRPNLNSSYTDTAYTGATWQANICDDVDGTTTWSDTLPTTKKSWDANGNGKVWVRAQAIVGGRTRSVVGLVQVNSTPALDAKYGLVSGGVTDDLGTTVNNLGANVFGGVLGGLLGVTPTVAADPSLTPSGVTGLRCGALDMQAVPASTCLAGTIGALNALPVVQTLLGGKLDQFPTLTAATPEAVAQLRTKAIATHTYYTSSPGGTTPATAPACSFATNTGTPSASTVVFIEQVGTTGASGSPLGPGDQFCYINVSSRVNYKALVIGSGRVILRGNGTASLPGSCTGALPQNNLFCGVVYALNQQRLSVADGGRGLGDAAVPGREVIRIENGAHVKGGVEADGKSAKVGIYPPALNAVNTNLLVDTLIPCTNLVTCLLNSTVKALGGVLSIVNDLVTRLGVAAVVGGILGQLNPQRAAYGSAITDDAATINQLQVYGASGVVSSTFRDLQAP